LKGIVEMQDFKSTKLKARVIETIGLYQKTVIEEKSCEDRVLLMAVRSRF
jgi:hypothetical protein